ncbi:MAG: phosphate propanoyltransferase [Peptococcaceae bacterium]|nr:phosphate propanoyltransferase [Peptococcaceae bacterium]
MASKEYEVLMQALLKAVQEASKENAASNATGVPVGISNRHIHLSQADLDQLFGAGYQLTPMKELSQPGQFACKETVTICGPKGAIEKVRVLGPVRKETQIEIVAGDCFKLGVKAPAKLSGDLAGTPGITVVGPRGSVQTAQGLIVAQRHIHMAPADAQAYGVQDGQIVKIRVGGLRGGIYDNVAIRVTTSSKLECHLDTEEANAMGVAGTVEIVR